MADARIALDLASFLDSPHAGHTPGLSREHERAALEIFLRAAYVDLGKAPRLLDEQELTGMLQRVLPGRYGRSDPVVPHLVELLGRYYDHLEQTETDYPAVAEAYRIQFEAMWGEALEPRLLREEKKIA